VTSPELPNVRYAGMNMFVVDDGEPMSAYRTQKALEAAGATPVQANAALKQARNEGPR